MEERKGGRVGGWEDGREEGRMGGWVEGREDGRVGGREEGWESGWKGGRVAGREGGWEDKETGIIIIKCLYPLLKALYNHTKSYIINKNLQMYNYILLYDT